MNRAPRVDYDRLADRYDARYGERSYRGIAETLHGWAMGGTTALEVGCGTGHWLGMLAAEGFRVAGLDPSIEMLRRGAERGAGPVVRGVAEALPFETASFERVYAVNALHHFADPDAFYREAGRTCAPGGSVMTIGLDPSAGRDAWFIYDYFPETVALDAARYPAAEAIRAGLTRAGFVDVETVEAEVIREAEDADALLARGGAEPGVSSQLALLDPTEHARGVERIRLDARRAARGGTPLVLRADLILFATIGKRPGR